MCKITLDKYVVNLEKIVAEGANSVVVEGTNQFTQEKVVVKILHADDEGKEEKIRNEIFVLQMLQGQKNVIRLLDVIEDEEGFFYLVLERLPTDLLDFINHYPGHLEESFVKKIFQKIVSVVKHMHSKKLFHGDLKLENVLLDPASPVKTLKVIDFGFSGSVHKKLESCPILTGTRGYTAPEVFRNFRNNASCDPFKCDIYSLGVLLFALLFKRFPFEDHSGPTYYDSLPDMCAPNDSPRSCRYSLPLLKTRKGISISPRSDFHLPEKHDLKKSSISQVEELLTRMLNLDPNARPTITEVAKHPWLKTNNTLFNSLRRKMNSNRN